jgi:hypothetical protein
MSWIAPVLVLTDAKTYHRSEKGTTMRDATAHISRRNYDAEAVFRETSRRDALRWLASQLRWERTLDTLRSEDGQQAQAA